MHKLQISKEKHQMTSIIKLPNRRKGEIITSSAVCKDVLYFSTQFRVFYLTPDNKLKELEFEETND